MLEDTCAQSITRSGSDEPGGRDATTGGVTQSGYDPAACALCDERGTTPVCDGPIVPIVECAGCGLMRQGPVPDRPPVSVVAFSGGIERMRGQRREKEQTQVVDYVRCLPVLADLLPEKGRLLEIGCATGVLLDRARQEGWDVLGIEPENWSCEIARERGLTVTNTLFGDAGVPDDSQDAVLLLHVIEHLPDPLDGLRVIRRMIRPGGFLVLETPRYDTLTFRVLKGRERSVIPGHLWYFDRETMRAMAERAGFEVVRLDSVGRTLTLDRLCYSISKVLNNRFATRALTGLSDLLRLRRARVHINLRDMMRLYLRKVEEPAQS